MGCQSVCADIWERTRRAGIGLFSWNRRRSLLKILSFDTGGYWIWSKLLEQGQFGPREGGREGKRIYEPNGFAGASRGDRYENHTTKKAVSEDYLNDSLRDKFAPRLDGQENWGVCFA